MPEIERARPAYQQIYEDLRGRILSGELGPDEQVPSARSLAASWSVQTGTVMRALAALQREGLTKTVAGKGTFVAPPLDCPRDFSEATEAATTHLSTARSLLINALERLDLSEDQRVTAVRVQDLVDSAIEELTAGAG